MFSYSDDTTGNPRAFHERPGQYKCRQSHDGETVNGGKGDLDKGCQLLPDKNIGECGRGGESQSYGCSHEQQYAECAEQKNRGGHMGFPPFPFCGISTGVQLAAISS